MRKSIDYYLIFLIVICAVGLAFFVGHYSNILIDVGREVYYPEQILNGQVLYKDIFNIYGALAYQINAFLYLVFGAKLSTLYFSGCVSSLLFICGIYLVSREFLPKFSSFAVALFAICVGVTTTSIFNFHFPYSWAMLYGTVLFLYSLLFLIKSNKTKNADYHCISAFLGGMCVACKYDFLLYSLIMLCYIVKKRNIKAFLCFIAVPFISTASLFLQGLRFSDIANSLSIYTAMAKSQTLKYFYQNSGIYFHKKAPLTDLMLFLKALIPFGLILLAKFQKNRIFYFILMTLGFVAVGYWCFTGKYYILGFLPVLLLILTILNFKTLKSSQKILAVSAILVSVKVFWVLLLNSYGSYYVPILLSAVLVVLLQSRFINGKAVKAGVFLVLFAAVCLLFLNIKDYKNTDVIIKTSKGTIKTTEIYADSTNKLLEYLKTAPQGDVLIFPEGLTVNFLANRMSDNFYNSLLPLYIETFDEKDIINRFEKTKPEYIILNNLDMKDYYFRFICTDYAFEFCGFVNENYTLDTIIGDNFRYLVFKLK